jgi:signal peptidase II
MRLFLALTLPLYVLDQITKFLVLAFIPTHVAIEVIPGFFNLVQVHNTGAAFGMLKDNNTFFIGLASVALIAVAVMARRGCFLDTPTRLGAALLASGIIGNLTDRILHGHVIDFLDVILPWYGHWPSFNVADSCICVAAFLFLISGFSGEKTANPPNKA